MDKLTGAQVIERFVLQYKALVELAETLQKLGSLEQVEAETKKRITAAQKDEEAAIGSLARVRASLKDAETNAARILAEANTRADELRAEAEHTAGQTMDAAERTAKAAIQSAELRVGRELAVAQQELDRLDVERKARVVELQKLMDEVNAKAAERSEITDKIAQAKAQLRAFVS